MKKYLKNLVFSALFTAGFMAAAIPSAAGNDLEIILKKDEKGRVHIENKNVDKNSGQYLPNKLFVLSPLKGESISISFEKSEGKGEAELMSSALTAEKEDVWAFYKEKGRESWANCGFQEESGRVGMSIDNILNQKFGDTIVTFYHIHPIKPGKKIFEKVYIELSKQYDKLDSNDERKKTAKDELIFSRLKTDLPILINANPSYGDFLLYKTLDAALKEHGIKTAPSRVVTPEGFFVYSCGNESDDKIKEKYLEFMDKIYKTREIDASKSFEYKKDDFEIKFIKKRDISSEEFYENIR